MEENKEERILIRKIEHECKFREIHETTAGGHTWADFSCGKFKKWKGCEEDDFIHCEKKELIGLSRQEAIERMAKAMCRKDEGLASCNECQRPKSCKHLIWQDFWGVAAEAALNALLSKHTLEERAEELVKNNAGIPDYDEFYKAIKEADNGGKN